MKNWVYKTVSVLLSALVVLASADVAFALPKKLPKLKGGKRPRITVPKTATRQLPPTSGVRPNVATQVERAVAVQAAKAVTTAQVAPAHTLQETPAISAVQDTGTKLKRTPEQVLAELELFIQKYQRLPLQAAKDPIERSLRAAVDNNIKRAKNPQDPIILRLKAIKDQFKERAEGRTPEQVLADLELFIQENGRFPVLEKDIPVEYSLRRAIDHAISNAKNPQHPTILRLTAIKKQWVKEVAEGRTPEQVLAELELFVDKNDRFPLQLAESPKERSLRHAVDGVMMRNNPQSPVVLRIMDIKQKFKKRADSKTKEQVLQEVELFIQKNNRFPSQDAEDPAECSLRRAFNRAIHISKDLQDPISLRFMALKKQWIREQTTARSPKQILADLELFIQKNNRFPSADAEDSFEYSLRNAVTNTIKNAKNPQDPIILRLIELKNQWVKKIAKQRTAQQVLEELELFIQENDRFPSQTAQNPKERSLRQAVYWAITNTKNPQDPIILKLTDLKEQWVKEKGERKTVEEYVALAQQYKTKPRSKIYRDRRKLPREEMTPAEKQEVIVGIALARYRTHPLVMSYLEQNRLQAASQTTEQLYTALTNYIKDYGHYPIRKKDSLANYIYHRLHYYQSSMVDGKYADPWLQKIYELKTLIQNAPDGKFTLTPDGQGGYTLEIEEPVTEELDVSAPQKVEELAPAVPSVHALHEHITEDIKNMILAVRDQAALERRDFYPWLRDMQQNHLDQIVNKDTSDALRALNRAISFDYKTGQNRRAVTYLLQTVNNYVGILGIDEELGYFNKIMYRGQLEPGMLPQADLFHVVAEQEGMSFDGTLAPQVEQLNKLAWQAYKQGQPLSVNFADDDNQDMLTALEIEKGVPIQTVKQDFQTAIQTLLPPGFEVRMGLHELGISGRDMTNFRKGHLHIHLERPATTEEMQDGFLTDVSISFKIQGLDRFVRKYNKYTRRVEPLTDKEIAQNYLTLFGTFLNQAAKDKLTELAR